MFNNDSNNNFIINNNNDFNYGKNGKLYSSEYTYNYEYYYKYYPSNNQPSYTIPSKGKLSSKDKHKSCLFPSQTNYIISNV